MLTREVHELKDVVRQSKELLEEVNDKLTDLDERMEEHEELVAAVTNASDELDQVEVKASEMLSHMSVLRQHLREISGLVE